jgi:hypothetical protein
MKIKLHFVDESGRNENNNRWGDDCVKCDTNSDCTKTDHNGTTIAEVIGTSNGNDARLEIEMEAFENDKGKRCEADLQKDHLFDFEKDDCYAKEQCSIHHDVTSGTETFKCPDKPRCHGSEPSSGCTDHQMTIQFSWG